MEMTDYEKRWIKRQGFSGCFQEVVRDGENFFSTPESLEKQYAGATENGTDERGLTANCKYFTI